MYALLLKKFNVLPNYHFYMCKCLRTSKVIGDTSCDCNWIFLTTNFSNIYVHKFQMC